MSVVELDVVELGLVDEVGRAACTETDPELWFSEDPHDQQACRAVCAACPVLDGCLTGALRRRERYGIWGGVVFPATVRTLIPIASTDETDRPVWRLRWTTWTGETVTFGVHSSYPAASRAATRLLGGLRIDGAPCAA